MKKVISKYINAVRWMYGFNKKGAVEYIKKTNIETLDCILSGYINQCGRAFYCD